MDEFEIDNNDLVAVNRDFETHNEVMNNNFTRGIKRSLIKKRGLRRTPILMQSGTCLKTIDIKSIDHFIDYKHYLNKYMATCISTNTRQNLIKDRHFEDKIERIKVQKDHLLLTKEAKIITQFKAINNI